MTFRPNLIDKTACQSDLFYYLCTVNERASAMRKSDLWKRISELDQDSTTLCEGTCMLLLRHRSDEGNEYKILEYNGQDGTFYNPFTEAEECVNTRQSRVDYLNLDRL